MQDIHSVGGGRLFSGGGGGGDRRLRPQHHQNQQALKCPRCDSLNTKFCYYNNYNLSQPRHFCKSCRRYWTKGGVLRNVPVGGGCRKTKRSKPKQTTTTDNTTTAPTTTATATATTTNTNSTVLLQAQGERKSSNSHSSSESSSLTATGNNSTGLEAVSAHSSSSATNSVLNGIGESKLFVHPNMNNNNNNNNNNSFERGGLLEQGSDCGIFSEIASFTSLITSSSSTDHSLQFGFGNIILNQQHHTLDHHNNNNNHQWHQQQKLMSTGEGDHQDFKMEDMAGGGLINVDQTVHVDLSALHNNNRSGNIGPLDWQASGTGVDQGLFDLPNAVDQNYWNQSQWSTDHDQTSLYLP